jgi:hypothetical protein
LRRSLSTEQAPACAYSSASSCPRCCRVEGFRVQEFRVQGLGFRVEGLGLRTEGLGLKV